MEIKLTKSDVEKILMCYRGSIEGVDCDVNIKYIFEPSCNNFYEDEELLIAEVKRKIQINRQLFEIVEVICDEDIYKYIKQFLQDSGYNNHGVEFLIISSKSKNGQDDFTIYAKFKNKQRENIKKE